MRRYTDREIKTILKVLTDRIYELETENERLKAQTDKLYIKARQLEYIEQTRQRKYEF